MAKAAAKPETAEYVVYLNAPGIREITKDDWAALGVEHEGVRWDASNNWAVRVDSLKLDEAILSNVVVPANGLALEVREVPPPVVEESDGTQV